MYKQEVGLYFYIAINLEFRSYIQCIFFKDIEISHFRGDVFESQIWRKLLDDVRNWNLGALDYIKAVKQQALEGKLRRMKAQAVAAFVEAVDRSATDPLITLRDTTGMTLICKHPLHTVLCSPNHENINSI